MKAEEVADDISNFQKEVPGFYLESPYLNVFGCGKTPEEALQDFKQDLFEVTDSLRNTPDEEMTKDCKVMKERLLAYEKEQNTGYNRN